jgi:hypothetical protein
MGRLRSGQFGLVPVFVPVFAIVDGQYPLLTKPAD